MLILPGRNQPARQPLLVRRDALVHDRARRGHRAAHQGARPRAPLPDALERARPRPRDPADRRARRDRHVRRLVRRRRAAPRGAHDRHPLDGRSGMVGYFVYRKRQGLDPRTRYKIERPQRPPDFEAFDYRTALVPIFGADVSASVAAQRRQADRRRGRRLRDLRAARSQPALARRRPRAGGGARALGARERAHPGAPRRHQDPHRADPHAQPGRRARRGSRAGRRRRDLLVDDPRPRRRAAHRPDRRLPAQQAALPGDHRDRQPHGASARSPAAPAPSARRPRPSGAAAARRCSARAASAEASASSRCGCANW